MDVKANHRRVNALREEVEEEEGWEPPLWKQQYENIRTMRSKRDAPVDKYGCFMNAEKEVPPEVCVVCMHTKLLAYVYYNMYE